MELLRIALVVASMTAMAVAIALYAAGEWHDGEWIDGAAICKDCE